MTTSNVSNTAATVPAATVTAPDQVISTSCNLVVALGFLEKYLNSTYDLQAADTELQAAISNQETSIVQKFEQTENGSGGTLYQLEHLTPDNDPNGKDDYASDVSKLTSQYGAESAENQQLTKVMDGNNTTAQNTLNQNSQGQQGVVTTMQSINSVPGNLKNLIQG